MPRLLKLLALLAAGVLVGMRPARAGDDDPGPLYAWTMPPP